MNVSAQVLKNGSVIARHRAWLKRELVSREMWVAGLHWKSQPARGMMELEARVLKEALESLDRELEGTAEELEAREFSGSAENENAV